MHAFETGLLLGRLPFARIGTAPNPILVINGGQGFMMKPEPARLAKDAARIGRILPDGQSFIVVGYDPNPNDVTVQAIAEAVGNVIGGQVDAPAIVVGISYGAVVATHIAAHYPDKVGRLALIAGAHDFSIEGRQRLARQIELARRDELKQLVLEFTSIFNRPWLNLLLRLRIGLRGRSIVERLASREVIIQYLEAMLQNNIELGDLNRISASTMVIAGSRDQFFAGTAPVTCQAIPGARLEILKGETHMAPIERAREIKTRLTAFLVER